MDYRLSTINYQLFSISSTVKGRPDNRSPGLGAARWRRVTTRGTPRPAAVNAVPSHRRADSTAVRGDPLLPRAVHPGHAHPPLLPERIKGTTGAKKGRET